MIIRILIAGFASFVAGFSYLTGLGRLMTGLLIGFGACCSAFFGILFLMPVDSDRLVFPIYEEGPAWPFFVLALILAVIVAIHFLTKVKPAENEEVNSKHFKYLAAGLGIYLTSLFLSSIYWFPSDKKRLEVLDSTLGVEVFIGTCLFLIGVTFSSILFYKASKGSSDRHPDLMRRFVLGLFTFLQLDKMPLLVAYLLIYSPETRVIFPYVTALALSAYIPVGLFLVKATLESQRIE